MGINCLREGFLCQFGLERIEKSCEEMPVQLGSTEIGSAIEEETENECWLMKNKGKENSKGKPGLKWYIRGIDLIIVGKD